MGMRMAVMLNDRGRQTLIRIPSGRLVASTLENSEAGSTGELMSRVSVAEESERSRQMATIDVLASVLSLRAHVWHICFTAAAELGGKQRGEIFEEHLCIVWPLRDSESAPGLPIHTSAPEPLPLVGTCSFLWDRPWSLMLCGLLSIPAEYMMRILSLLS